MNKKKLLVRALSLAAVLLTLGPVDAFAKIVVYPGNYPGVRFSGDACTMTDANGTRYDGTVLSGPGCTSSTGSCCVVVRPTIVQPGTIILEASDMAYDQRSGMWCRESTEGETVCQQDGPVCGG